MGPSEPSPYASRFLHSLVTSSRSARSPRSCLRRVWLEEGTSVRGENVTRVKRTETRSLPSHSVTLATLSTLHTPRREERARRDERYAIGLAPDGGGE